MKQFNTIKKSAPEISEKVNFLGTTLILLAIIFSAGINANAQFVSGNNVAVLVAASASSSNTTASIVEINKATTNQPAQSTQNISSSILRFSGSAGTTMYLANSNDGTLICVAGANTATTSGNANTFTTRGVGTYNSVGTFNLATTYTGASGNQFRGATSLDNSNWYIADQGGLYTNNGTAGSPATNFLCAKAFGGAVYMGTSSSVGIASAATGGTVTGLNGLTTGTITDFYLISSGANGSTYDVLYTVNNSSATAGTIAKYSLSGGSWQSNGSYTTSFGGCRMAAEANGSGANLYVSSGVGSTAANSVIKLIDAAGFNATINITTGNNVTLYTTGASATIKGVAFTPVATVSANPTSLSFSNTTAGSISAGTSFVLSSSSLVPSTGGNLAVTSPSTDFQVSADSNTWGATATIAYTSANLSAKVYARFTPQTSGSKSGNITFSGAAIGNSPTTVTVSGLAPAAPTQFVITNVTPSSPLQNGLFSITVTAEDNSNGIQNVQANTNVSLAVTTGTGTLSGSTTGQITTGNSSITFSNLSYNVGETIVVTASGDLASGASSGIVVQPVATHLVANLPPSGVVGVTLPSFTVTATKVDGTADANYTGNITLAVNSGPGSISGTLTQAAVAGVATFNDIQFGAAGTYADTIFSGTLTGANGTTAINSYPSTLVHYWNFNSTLPCKGAGGIALTPLAANYSLISGGNARLTWTDTSTVGVQDSIVDNGQYGATLNERDNIYYVDTTSCSNMYVRARNPSGSNLFTWYLPTTGYKKIVLKYATEGTGSGQTNQNFKYTIDGTNFVTTNLPITQFTNTAASQANFVLVSIDLTSISGANNNPNFAFQIAFTGNNTGTSGNNRFDNITLEGDSICSVASLPAVSSNITNTCPGTSNGVITINASGGAGAYTYIWSGNAATTSSLSGLAAATYTVIVTDANGCSSTGQEAVQLYPTPTPVISGSLTFCPGGSTTLDAGAGYSSYLWTGGATTETISVNTTGTDSVTVTNNNGCPGTTSATVSQASNLTPVIQGALSFCAGSSTTLSSPGYDTYLWSDGETTSSINITATNSYSLSVTLGACSGSSSSVQAVEHPLPSVGATDDQSICIGSSASLNATGASSYIWSPGGVTGSSISVNPASTTTYTVTGTDANQCSSTATTTITVNTAPVVGVLPISDVLCAGDSVTLTASGASSYIWTLSSGLSSASGTSVNASPSANTTYTVTGTDGNNCSNSATTAITVVPAPEAPSTNTTITLCQASAVTALSATPTPSTATLLWYATPTGGIGSATAPVPSTTNVGATHYYASEKFTDSLQIAITGINGNTSPNKEFSFLALSAIPAGTVIYFTNDSLNASGFAGHSATTLQGNKNVVKFIANNQISAGTVIISYSTSVNYTWVADGVTPIDGSNAANGVFNALGQSKNGAWIYAFQSPVSTDPVGNISRFLFVFANTTASGAVTLTNTGLSKSDGTFVAFGGGGSVTKIYPDNDGQTRSAYQWYQYLADTTKYTKSNSGTDFPDASFSVATGCPDRESQRIAIEVDVLPAPDPGASSNSPVCTGGEIDFSVDPNGFYSDEPYQWSGPNGFSTGNQFPSIANATLADTGLYIATVIESDDGCTNSDTIVVQVNTPTTSNTVVSACDQYAWNGVTYTTSTTVTNHFTNAGGCDSAATLNLTINNGTGSSSSVSACSSYNLPWDSSVTVTGNYSHDYQTINGCDSLVTVQVTISNAVTNTYSASSCDSYMLPWDSVTTASGSFSHDYTTAGGCDSVVTISVTVTPSTKIVSTQSACDSYIWPVNGQTYNATGNYASVTGCHTDSLYLTITASTKTITTISACDSYTWSVNGQTYTSSQNVADVTGCHTDSLYLTITPTGTNVTTASACDSYIWSANGQTYNATGSYAYLNGCITDSLYLTITPSSNTVANVTNCGPYTWSVNGQTYSVSGSYAAVTGCHTDSLYLTINPVPVVTDSSTNVICNGGTNGLAVAVASGGTSPYTYLWSNGATTSAITGLAANTYSVTVTDKNSCTASFKKLIHYWSFDNTSPSNGVGGVNVSPVAADYSTIGGASIVFNQVLTPTRDSILDNGSGGSNVNLRTGYVTSANGNLYVRTRNPNNEETLKFNMPTTGYQNIVLSFAEEASSAGKDTNIYSYSIDGTNFITASLAVTKYAAGLNWGLVTIDLRGVSGVNNNPNFVFAIGNNVNTTSGNTRYDNVSLEGDSIVSGNPSVGVIISQPAALNTTIAAGGSTTFCTPGSVTLAAASGMASYLWSPGGATTSSITVSASGSYSVTVTSGGCSATSSGTTVAANSPSTSATTVTTCNSYAWNGVTYTQSTNVTDHFTNAALCDSAATLNLTITSSSSTQVTVASSCDSYIWTSNGDGQTYNASGSYAYINGCVTDSLYLTITASSKTVANVTNCGPYTWPVNGQTYSASQNVASVTGCHTDSLYLIINASPVVTDSSSNTSCNGSSDGVAVAVVNGGTVPYTYLWSNGATTSSITAAANTYSVAVTDHNSCTATFKKLIHYWDFNNTLPLGGGGKINISPVAADYSSIGGARITFNQILTPRRDSILDNNSSGASVNLRTGYTTTTNGNNSVRARNPNSEDTLLFYMPTTGYQNIVFSFASELSSTGKGQLKYAYSTDGGQTYITTGLTSTTFTPGTNWSLVTINLSGVSAVNNNPNFIFSIMDTVAVGTSGNQVYDNITLEGDSIVLGFASQGVIITQPAALNTAITASGPTTFCTGGSVTLAAPAGMKSYAWSSGQTTSAITVSATGNYSVTVTKGSCSASSAATTVTVNGSSTIVTTAAACDSYIWSANGQTYTSTGAYAFVTGCNIDSLYLTITPSATTVTTITNACDSYTWEVNGQTYTSSGAYASVTGCQTDSLYLTVTTSGTTVTTASACDSYTWDVNGQTYTSSQNVAMVNGCHTDSLYLTITPSGITVTTASACNSYTWDVNGQTYTSSQNVAVVNGCHTDSLYLTVTTSGTTVTAASACDSYTWDVNGQTYTSSQNVAVVNGCHTDSLYLTITLSGTTVTTASACNSYTWDVNGQTYTSSQNVAVVNGCHTDSLYLTVTTSGTTVTTASTCDSYTWDVNDQTYTSSQNVAVVNGCHTDSLYLTITPSGTTVTTASACDSYTWDVNGQTYTSSQNVAVVNGCETDSLYLTINSSSSSDTSIATCSGYTWNGVTYTSSTTVTDHFTNATGCDSAATLHLTINNPPAAPTLTVAQPTCNVSTGTITVTAPKGSGIFYSVDGVTYTNTSGIFSGLTPASYTVTAELNGCSSLGTDTILTTPSAPPAPVITVVNNCNKTSKLSTTATGSLLWSTHATTSSITVSTAGTYSVTATVGGCVSLAGTGVAAPGSTPATPAITAVNSCGSSTLSTKATGSLLWNTTATTSSINVTAAGKYIVTTTVNGCTSVGGSGTAAPKAVPSAPAVTDADRCGSSLLSTKAKGTLHWSTGKTTSSITVTASGIYSVTTTVSGCISIAGTGTAAPKTVPTAPVVNVSNNCGSSLLSTSATGSLLWSTGATTSSITETKAATYTVITKAVDGCASVAGSGKAAPIAVPAAPSVTVANNCDNSKLSTTSGGALFWSNGATTTSITVTVSGAYTVTTTENGCVSKAGSGSAAPKSIPGAPVVSAANNCGSSLLSTKTTGTLLWSNGKTSSSITVTAAGTYSVTTTVNGCVSGDGTGVAAPLIVPPTPVVTVANNCSSSMLSTIATGALHWSTGVTTSAITVTIAHTYSVTTTVGGCVSASGTGTSAPLTVPATPGTITGKASACKNTGPFTYSIAAVANATSYIWTLPSGSSAASLTTTNPSIAVTFGASAATGNITVKASNTCGVSAAASSKKITMDCRETDNAPETDASANMLVYPNPTSDRVNVTFNLSKSGNYTLHLMDISGRLMLTQVNAAQEGNNFVELDLSNYAKGLYFLSLTTDDGNRQIVKVVVE